MTDKPKLRRVVIDDKPTVIDDDYVSPELEAAWAALDKQREERERKESLSNAWREFWVALFTPYPRHYLSVGPSSFPALTIVVGIILLIFYL